MNKQTNIIGAHDWGTFLNGVMFRTGYWLSKHHLISGVMGSHTSTDIPYKYTCFKWNFWTPRSIAWVIRNQAWKSWRQHPNRY